MIDQREHPQEASTDKEIQIGSLRLLNALNVKALQQASPHEGLLYVEAKMNGHFAKALIDTGNSQLCVNRCGKTVGLKIK